MIRVLGGHEMAAHWLQSSLIKAAFAIALAAQAGFAGATVTMVGTRVIYDAKSQGQTLRFDNHGSASVMQLWIDSGNEKSTPDTADGPFVVTPPVFRIDAGGGQSVRLIFTGKDLPQDRESVFYLNTLQIPSLDKAHSDQNQMVLMVRNRLKIFYRPGGIAGNPARAIEGLNFHVAGEGKQKHVAVSNQSGYFVTVATGSLICGSETAQLRPVMIAPFSDAELTAKGKCPLDAASIRAEVRYIDDFGAVRDAKFPVAAQSAK
jgi:fimbrial chaperone protein